MSGPLTDFSVVDVSSVVSGPLASMIMADQGADVIKVESPGLGDLTRLPMNLRDGMTGLFANCNRGKRSIVIDLKADAGRGIVLDLVKNADVFIENWRPGAAERLGLGEDSVLGFMNVLALEGASHSIHVNCLAPGAATRMTATVPGRSDDVADPDPTRHPSLVSPAVLFMCSEEGPNGVTINAAGGNFSRAQVVVNKGVRRS